MVTYEIVTRQYGLECLYHYQSADGDINGSFVIQSGDDVEAMIESEIVSTQNQQSVVPSPEKEDKSSIFTWIEPEKESIKYEIISVMRQGKSLDEYISGMDWQKKALVQTLVYRYAVNARDQLGASLASESQLDCWNLLSYLANTMSDAQIAEVL